jgi:nitrate reductase gamma subunit
MSPFSLIYTALAYAAILVFFAGFLYRIWVYAKTPEPLVIVGTPGAKTAVGTAARVGMDVVFFSSLFKGNKAIWIGGYVFHGALVLIIFRHLRYFFDPLPDWYMYVEPVGIYAGFAALLALLYLWGRRLFHERTRYISSFSDHFALLLLIAIAGTGLLMKFVVRTDVVAAKAFVLGLVRLHPAPLPADPWFLLHFTLVLVLLVYFPFSKLMHAGGMFFSPTRNQADWTRSNEPRHVAPF